MKFRCNKESLLREISLAKEFLSSSNSFSILSNILLISNGNNLIIKATDTKVGFETTIPVESEIDGETKIYCDKFLNILKNFPDDEVIFEKKESDITVRNSNKKSTSTLKTISKEEYPKMKEISEENFFEISQPVLLEMINQTLFAISDDETRFFMNGVYLEKGENCLIMVATDGRRLSYIKKEYTKAIPEFTPVIIPSKVLNILKKVLFSEGNIKVAIYDKSIFFKNSTQLFYSNLIDGQFPNYKRVIPEKQDFSFIFNTQEFLNASKRVDLFVEKSSKKLFINLNKNSLTLNSDKTEIGESSEIIDCQYDGDKITMIINSQYLEEPLKCLGTENAEIEFTASNKAITLKSVPSKEFFHIIMPMQS